MNRSLGVLSLLALFFLSSARPAASQLRPSQDRAEPYTQANSFGLFAEYSNTSSHIYLGHSGQRKIASLGASYTRRLFRTRSGELRFLIELRPAFELSDPVATTDTFYFNSRFPLAQRTSSYRSVSIPAASCHSGSMSYTSSPWHPPNGFYRIFQSSTTTCDRRWTYAQGLAPIGLQNAFRRHHPVRPFLSGNVGYLFTTRPIPTPNAGSFNFMFAFGAGVELYRRDHQALTLEYRLNHISNKYTALTNPGIDSNLFRVAYSFGR